MILELRISALGVIDESVMPLGPGFTVITGETGAGKTMLITALGLLLGGRADSGVIREGASLARVEGVVTAPEELQTAAEQHGGVIEDGLLILNRQVSAQGRSRAFLGGSSVPASVLGELSKSLVTVHGQADQLKLLRPGASLAALDAYGGADLAKDLSSYQVDYARLRTVEKALHDEVANARALTLELEMLQHGLAEIEALDPKAGEEIELAVEEARLGAVDELRSASSTAREILSSDQGEPDVIGSLALVRKELDKVAELDSTAVELANRATEASYLVSELAADLSTYLSAIEIDPLRLSAVSERRAALAILTRKYGQNIAEVLEWSRAAATRVGELDGSEERLQALRAESAQIRIRLANQAARISARRIDLAKELSSSVTEEVRQLSMPHAELRFEISQTQLPSEATEGLAMKNGQFAFSETGIDQVDILFSGHPGSGLRPLHKGASGGELSRVMLGLEVVLAGADPTPTMVFDEVDAGVGGRAAVEIGRRLAMLAANTQVLVVTHLPQVAAFADSHVVVRKSSDGSITTSGLEELDESGRVRELSRMLAGLEGSDTAQAHAEELLRVAKEARQLS